MVQPFFSDGLLAKENLYIFKPGFQTHLLNLNFNAVHGVLEGETNPHVFKCRLLHLMLDKTPSDQKIELGWASEGHMVLLPPAQYYWK